MTTGDALLLPLTKGHLSNKDRFFWQKGVLIRGWGATVYSPEDWLGSRGKLRNSIQFANNSLAE